MILSKHAFRKNLYNIREESDLAELISSLVVLWKNPHNTTTCVLFRTITEPAYSFLLSTMSSPSSRSFDNYLIRYRSMSLEPPWWCGPQETSNTSSKRFRFLPRKIEISTGWDRILAADYSHGLDGWDSDPSKSIMRTFKEVNTSFGGELWVEKTLCFKDGVEISQISSYRGKEI